MPAWLAVMEQEPAARMVTVVPETVQTEVVVEAKATVRLEEAVAPMVKGDTPKVTLLSAPNVMVCVAGLTVKLWVTGVAAEKLALPAWLAVMEQIPAALIVTIFPATVHTAGVPLAKLTGRPEVAVTPRMAIIKAPTMIVYGLRREKLGTCDLL